MLCYVPPNFDPPAEQQLRFRAFFGRSELSLSTIFFWSSYILFFSYSSLGPSYSKNIPRNIPTENLFHTLMEQKSELSRVKKWPPNAILHDFPARNLSRDAKSTVNPADQLVRHRRCKVNCQTAIMCSVKSSKRLEYEDIPDLEYRKETLTIFRGISRITKLSNTSYIPKEYAEYRTVPTA